jgi:hypothetical protein
MKKEVGRRNRDKEVATQVCKAKSAYVDAKIGS